MESYGDSDVLDGTGNLRLRRWTQSLLLLRALVDPTGEEGFNSCTVSVALGGVLGGVDEFKEAAVGNLLWFLLELLLCYRFEGENSLKGY